MFARSFVVISCSPGLKAIVYSLDLRELEPTHSKQRWEDQFDYKSSVLGPVDGTLCKTLMHASLDDLSCLEQYSKLQALFRRPSKSYRPNSDQRSNTNQQTFRTPAHNYFLSSL
jgi:hypothetical protein